MPEFEKIGNDGKPTGVKKTFNFNEAAKLRKMKNSRWKELPGDKPKISRNTPIEGTDKNKELVNQWPQKIGDQLKMVRAEKSLEKLEVMKQLADDKDVINAIDSRVKHLKYAPGSEV